MTNVTLWDQSNAIVADLYIVKQGECVSTINGFRTVLQVISGVKMPSVTHLRQLNAIAPVQFIVMPVGNASITNG